MVDSFVLLRITLSILLGFVLLYSSGQISDALLAQQIKRGKKEKANLNKVLKRHIPIALGCILAIFALLLA